MPELPEVERGRALLERIAVGRTIQRVDAADDERVFREASPSTVRRALVRRHILEAHRWGKYLWLVLDGTGPHPLFHFGMSGAFHAPGTLVVQLKSGPRVKVRDPWPPKFWKLRLYLDDGGEVAMTNARRLGRIVLRDNPIGEAPIADLGFDPLRDMPSTRVLLERLQPRASPIKSVLLDQRLFSGVGNWIADEVLYQAKIDPRRQASALTKPDVQRLRSCLSRIVRRAVAVDANSAQFPRAWLFHHRWGRTKGACTARGERIAFLEVGGRTTAWVPGRQR